MIVSNPNVSNAHCIKLFLFIIDTGLVHQNVPEVHEDPDHVHHVNTARNMKEKVDAVLAPMRNVNIEEAVDQNHVKDVKCHHVNG